MYSHPYTAWHIRAHGLRCPLRRCAQTICLDYAMVSCCVMTAARAQTACHCVHVCSLCWTSAWTSKVEPSAHRITSLASTTTRLTAHAKLVDPERIPPPPAHRSPVVPLFYLTSGSSRTGKVSSLPPKRSSSPSPWYETSGDISMASCAEPSASFASLPPAAKIRCRFSA